VGAISLVLGLDGCGWVFRGDGIRHVSSDGCTAVAKGDFSAVSVDPDGGPPPVFVLCPWYGTGRHRDRGGWRWSFFFRNTALAAMPACRCGRVCGLSAGGAHLAAGLERMQRDSSPHHGGPRRSDFLT
jgi:hypothetical protein